MHFTCTCTLVHQPLDGNSFQNWLKSNSSLFGFTQICSCLLGYNEINGFTIKLLHQSDRSTIFNLIENRNCLLNNDGKTTHIIKLFSEIVMPYCTRNLSRFWPDFDLIDMPDVLTFYQSVYRLKLFKRSRFLGIYKTNSVSCSVARSGQISIRINNANTFSDSVSIDKSKNSFKCTES